MTSNHDDGSTRNDDRGNWSKSNRREVAEDRKIGQIILGSLAVLALVFGLIVMFSGGTFNVAGRGEPVTTGSTGATPTNVPTR